MNSFQLKVLGCVLMVVDHTALLFPPTVGLVMHWVGRIAAPLFIFLCGQSMEHTRSKERYVLRLYGAGVAMTLVEILLNRTGNIFMTLFHIALVIWILSRDRVRSRVLGMAAYIVWQVAVAVFFGLADMGTLWSSVLGNLCGSVMLLDGGYWYVLLGVLMWLCRSSRVRLAVAFAVLVVILLFMTSPLAFALAQWDGTGAVRLMLGILGSPTPSPTLAEWMPFAVHYQWMMIAALPFIISYNGERGRPVKWFFYVFYPAHLIAITILMNVLGVTLGA